MESKLHLIYVDLQTERICVNWVVDNFVVLILRPGGVLAKDEFIGSERFFSSF